MPKEKRGLALLSEYKAPQLSVFFFKGGGGCNHVFGGADGVFLSGGGLGVVFEVVKWRLGFGSFGRPGARGGGGGIDLGGGRGFMAESTRDSRQRYSGFVELVLVRVGVGGLFAGGLRTQ